MGWWMLGLVKKLRWWVGGEWIFGHISMFVGLPEKSMGVNRLNQMNFQWTLRKSWIQEEDRADTGCSAMKNPPFVDGPMIQTLASARISHLATFHSTPLRVGQSLANHHVLWLLTMLNHDFCWLNQLNPMKSHEITIKSSLNPTKSHQIPWNHHYKLLLSHRRLPGLQRLGFPVFVLQKPVETVALEQLGAWWFIVVKSGS